MGGPLGGLALEGPWQVSAAEGRCRGQAGWSRPRGVEPLSSAHLLHTGAPGWPWCLLENEGVAGAWGREPDKRPYVLFSCRLQGLTGML